MSERSINIGHNPEESRSLLKIMSYENLPLNPLLRK